MLNIDHSGALDVFVEDCPKDDRQTFVGIVIIHDTRGLNVEIQGLQA
jgi:hypothetical protein